MYSSTTDCTGALKSDSPHIQESNRITVLPVGCCRRVASLFVAARPQGGRGQGEPTQDRQKRTEC